MRTFSSNCTFEKCKYSFECEFSRKWGIAFETGIESGTESGIESGTESGIESKTESEFQ